MKSLGMLLLFPLLFACQKYNKPSYDKKEEILRQFPVENTNRMVLDSLWIKRDSLTYLRLKNLDLILMNETSSIPNWIGGFEKIRIFQIVNEKKRVGYIPNSIGKLSKLVEFDIPNNSVNSLPDSFYKLKDLTYLDLSNNPIVSIDNKISYLSNLESINLDHTFINNLPVNICKLQKIKYFTLENTPISDLPNCLNNMSNLEWINISGTKITEIPIEIFSAPKLKTINARRLKLKNYKEVKSICKKRKIIFYYDEKK